MSVMKIRGHGVDTKVYQQDTMAQREHVFVSSESGRSWGCMGRDLTGDVKDNRILVEGSAEEEWVNEIAGPDNNHTAGIVNKITGVCHQCANRLLIPIGKNVHQAYGNEVAILSFGLYGPDINEVIDVVTSAAQRVNARQPGTIAQAEIDAAVKQINNHLQDEFEVIKNDFEERNPIDVDALSPPLLEKIKAIHANFVQRRGEIYQSYKVTMDSGAYQQALRTSLRQALEDFQALLGEELYLKIFRYSPQDALQYIV